MDTLARDIARRAHALDSARLDATLRRLDLPDWPLLVRDLTFWSHDTGGGCEMLLAELPGTGGHQVGITDGEVGLPTRGDTFWLGILDPGDEELYSVAVENGRVLPPLPGE